MKRKTPEIPEFGKPEAENLFLASNKGLHTYAHLEKFRRFFLQFLFDFEHNFKRPVGFISHSCDELVFSIGACWQLGIPFVIFNPTAPKHQLESQLKAIKPGLVFIDEQSVEDHGREEYISLSELSIERADTIELSESRKAKKFKADSDPENVFGYFFTSGTTGNPKIVPLKRRQILWAAAASAENFKPRPNHFWLLCLPLNHIGGVTIILRSILYGSSVYRTEGFNRNNVATFLSENNLFQAASLVPTMLKRLLDDRIFRTHSNFKAILLGGGPTDIELLRKSRERGIPAVAIYGMTETCAQIAANPLMKPGGLYRPLSSVGGIFSPNSIEIRDEKGKQLATNEPGIIWLKGAQVFDGYLNDNKEAFDDEGWFNTGDYGRVNANGHLFIESRRTDLIITGGENVSPREVETELQKFDSIIEAAVLGIEDEEWGQRIVAVVVAKTKEKIETESIREQLKERMIAFKIPKEIKQADALPRTETGKVKRAELVKMFK